MEKEYTIPGQKKRIALFYNEEDYINALKEAETLRQNYMVSVFNRPKKLGKFLGKLEAHEFDGYRVFGEEDGIKMFDR